MDFSRDCWRVCPLLGVDFRPQILTTDGIYRAVCSKNRGAVGKRVSLRPWFGQMYVIWQFVGTLPAQTFVQAVVGGRAYWAPL